MKLKTYSTVIFKQKDGEKKMVMAGVHDFPDAVAKGLLARGKAEKMTAEKAKA